MSTDLLRQRLLDHYNESELIELCVDLGVVYEDLPGNSRRENIIELVGYLARRGRLADLVRIGRQKRPDVAWPEVTAAEAPGPGPTLEVAPGTNPFTYGNPISEPGRFFGRFREVEQVFSRLRNPEKESSSLVGGRRVGKTSMLKYLAHPLVRDRYGLDPAVYLFVYVDLQMLSDRTTPLQLWRHLLGRIERHVPDADVKLMIRQLQTAEYLDGFALADVFDAIDRLGSHVVLLLDEFELVTGNPNFAPDFFHSMRSLAIHYPLSLVTSSHHDLIELTHSEAIRSSPFFNIFANINLGLFSPDEARQLIETALVGTGVTFEDTEVAEIFRRAGRYPFFLQVAAHFLFDAYRQGLDGTARLDYLHGRFEQEAASHLAHFWRDSDDHERMIMIMLALRSRQAGGPTVADVAWLRGVAGRAEQTVAQLEQRALAVKSDGGYGLFSQTFANWILEEIAASPAESGAYRDWLAANRAALDALPATARKAIEPLLPRVAENYRLLVVHWAAEHSDASKAVALLQQVLV